MTILDIDLCRPTDCSYFGVGWPWCPSVRHRKYVTNATTSPEEDNERKLLLRKIAAAYEQPLKIGHLPRRFGYWQNALFSSLPINSLRRIACDCDPERIKSLSDTPKYFGKCRKLQHCLLRRSILLANSTKSVVIDKSILANESNPKTCYGVPKLLGKLVEERDGKACIVTGATNNMSARRIVPAELFALGKPGFSSRFVIGYYMFEKQFGRILRACIAYLNKHGDQKWNLLSLSAEMHNLFGKGLLNFKSLRVSVDRSQRSGAKYSATFSAHFTQRDYVHGKNKNKAGVTSRSKPTCKLCRKNAEVASLYEGKVINIPCDTRAQAHEMLSLLALRWVFTPLCRPPGPERPRRHRKRRMFESAAAGRGDAPDSGYESAEPLGSLKQQGSPLKKLPIEIRQQTRKLLKHTRNSCIELSSDSRMLHGKSDPRVVVHVDPNPAQ